jgi:simple sugar transport system permease protein
VVLAGLLFGALNGGGTLMEAATGVPSDVVDVIKGLIVLLVAAPPLIRLLFRLRAADPAQQAMGAKGWSA